MKYSLRVLAAALILLAICLYMEVFSSPSSSTSSSLWRNILFLQNQKEDEVAMYDRLVSPVRPLLPKGEYVEFLTDLKLNGEVYLRGYYNVRYVLSDVRLAYDRPCALALMVFDNPADVEPMARERGYLVDKVFQNIALLRRNPAAPALRSATQSEGGRP